MSDVDFLEAQVRGLERENLALRMVLWDHFFAAAIATCLKHGALTGPKMAAETADEMMRIRAGRVAGYNT